MTAAPVLYEAGAVAVDVELRAATVEMANAALAPRTRVEHERNWAHWRRWAADRHRPVLPADPADVADWCVWQYRRGIKPSTISTRLSAVAVYHAAAGVVRPTRSEQVRRVMEGLRRDHCQPPRRVRPLDVPALTGVVARWTGRRTRAGGTRARCCSASRSPRDGPSWRRCGSATLSTATTDCGSPSARARPTRPARAPCSVCRNGRRRTCARSSLSTPGSPPFRKAGL